MVTSRRVRQITSLAAAVGLVTLGGPAPAQTVVREVVIEAPQVVHETLGKTSSGGVDEVVSVAHHVHYDDLDLSRTADAAIFQDRVRAAARIGCNQLKRLYPLAPHDPDCVRKAVAHAAPQMRAALAHR